MVTTATPTRMCACGLPLHYTNPFALAVTDHLVERLGEYTTVTTPDGRYRVQRHYISLHGIKAVELPELAAKGIVEVLP